MQWMIFFVAAVYGTKLRYERICKKPGAIVIDVGISKINSKIVGDAAL